MAVTTSERSNGCNNARVRDDDETDGVVVPPNPVAVVIVEDDNGDAGEGEEDDDDEGSVFVEGRWLVVTPTSDVLREAVADEEQPTSDPDPDPDPDDPEAEAVFPAEDRGARGDHAGGDDGMARDDADVLLLVFPTRPLRYCAFH